MKRIITLILLLGCVLALAAQVNGNLQQIGDKKILKVWGSHYERGQAQGYYTAPQIMAVFQDFFWTMFCFSSTSYYSYITSYYNQHFSPAPELVNELNGLLSGIQLSGQSLFHQGLNRELGIDDLLLLNAMYDLVEVQENLPQPRQLSLGCASLASWGATTAADSLLASSAVITRFLDISQNSALIAAPLLVVHFPAETDEQKWLNFTLPGFVGALTAVNTASVYASMNTATDFYPTNPSEPINPILFDLRRGIEKIDFDGNGQRNPMDVFVAISAADHLSEFVVQTLQETAGNTFGAVIETKYGTSVYRTVGQYSGLPGTHLGATNHFRMLASPACCNRYYQIQDSLYANSQMSAKRQWNLMGGAAGLETTLSAVQWTPSTGLLLWASATTEEPAWQRPAIALYADELFNAPVSADDEYVPNPHKLLSLYPNPLKSGDRLQLKSERPVRKVQIFNLKGQKVYESKPESSSKYIDPSFEPNLSRAGIYQLIAEFGDGQRQTQKLVVY